MFNSEKSIWIKFPLAVEILYPECFVYFICNHDFSCFFLAYFFKYTNISSSTTFFCMKMTGSDYFFFFFLSSQETTCL